MWRFILFLTLVQTSLVFSHDVTCSELTSTLLWYILVRTWSPLLCFIYTINSEASEGYPITFKDLFDESHTTNQLEASFKPLLECFLLSFFSFHPCPSLFFLYFYSWNNMIFDDSNVLAPAAPRPSFSASLQQLHFT
jgi:hypothetical protein